MVIQKKGKKYIGLELEAETKRNKRNMTFSKSHIVDIMTYLIFHRKSYD